MGLKAYLEDYLKPKKWIYQKEHHEIKQSGATNDSFRISTGMIRRPRHVFIWAVPTLSYNNQGANIFTFGISDIGRNRVYSRAQLELNDGTHYPQLEITLVEESRLYRTLMSHSSAYNDFLCGSLIDRTNIKNLFGLLYFDLRNQEDDVKDSVVSLTFRYQLMGNFYPAGYCSLWKRVIAWGRSRAASAYGIVWGDAGQTNMAEVSADYSGDSKVLTEPDSNKVEVIERSKSESINLREDDVPGAILPRKIPEECTVKQLQRWLLCRGAKTTGKKMQLVQR